jgi:hypothetical protein
VWRDAPSTAPTASRPTRGVLRTSTSHSDSLPVTQRGVTDTRARGAQLLSRRARLPAGRATTSARHCIQLGECPSSPGDWRSYDLSPRGSATWQRLDSTLLASARPLWRPSPCASARLEVRHPPCPALRVSLQLTPVVLSLPTSAVHKAVVARHTATQRAASSPAAAGGGIRST